MSITLASPYTVVINGSQVENDTVGALVSFAVDYIGCLMTVVYKVGTLSGNPATFNAGVFASNPANGKIITVVVYIGPTTASQTFGQWWLNGVLQGTIVPSANLTTPIANAIAQWNSAEAFAAVSGGLLPGTTVAWAATAGGTLP